ncbi:MAG: STAS domain-containing protein [bacterium]|nr:STAS domain-containing protein [bacterium]
MTDTPATFSEAQGIIVIRVPGHELSHQTDQCIQEHIPNCPDQQKPPAFVLDLSELTFLGSVGLTVLVVFLKRVKSIGGKMVLAGLSEQCRKVMKVTKLDRAFDFYDNAEEAVSALKND